MYKLSYYRYAEAATMTTGQYGFDRVRNVVIGRPDIELACMQRFESGICMVQACARGEAAEPASIKREGKELAYLCNMQVPLARRLQRGGKRYRMNTLVCVSIIDNPFPADLLGRVSMSSAS